MLLGLWIVAGHRNETIRKVGGDMGEVQIVDQAGILAPALSFSYKKG